MLIHSDEIRPRQVDETLSIRQLFAGDEFQFDVAAAMLGGIHPRVVNAVSDRAYYFLDGSATVTVGDETYQVKKDDVVIIRRGVPHGLEGTAKYLIITSPPFDPKNEEVLTDEN